MKNTVPLIAVISILLIWTGSVYSQPQNQQLGIQQIAPPPPQTPPVAPPQRANTGMNEQLRQKLADQILNNKNLNLNTLIQHLRQIRTNRLNRQQAAVHPRQGLGVQSVRAPVGAGAANQAGILGQGQGRNQAVNRAGRGLGRGGGNAGLGFGPGPGRGLGRTTGTVGRGMLYGGGRGINMRLRDGSCILDPQILPGQGYSLGLRQSATAGAGNVVGRGLGYGVGRGVGYGGGRGVGYGVGRGVGYGGGRGINLRLRDGSCVYQGFGTGIGARAGLGRGLGRGAGVVGRGRGLGIGIIRDEQLPPEDELLEQLEQLNEQELNQVLEEIQQIK